MRVRVGLDEPFRLGAVETTPTIGIIDFSRRETDKFGVTRVVERAYSKRLSVKLVLPSDTADDVQAHLASLRATAGLWVADDQIRWLLVPGFYKDFEINHAVPPVSYCTLTVESLDVTDVQADPGGDPAPVGRASSMQLLQPTAITSAMLVSSSIAENDYIAWSSGANYEAGARVISPITHNIYESLASFNAGHDPADSDQWLEVGPTNRWAMFDEALGTATSGPSPLTVTLAPGAADALALLDVVGTSVRVQATGYDQTLAPASGAATFFDLPLDGGQITVTLTGAGTVSIGTLLVGRMRALGLTEAEPTSGITDFSRKDRDAFGTVTLVERAWAKRMSAKSLIRTDAVDTVADRLVTVRAKPALWMADRLRDSLKVYGFVKEWSIEVGETTSKLSLSIEGLSKAVVGSDGLTNVSPSDNNRVRYSPVVPGRLLGYESNALGGATLIEAFAFELGGRNYYQGSFQFTANGQSASVLTSKTNRIPVRPGERLSIQALLVVGTYGIGGRLVEADVQWLDAAGLYISSTALVTGATAGTYNAKIFAEAPANAFSAYIEAAAFAGNGTVGRVDIAISDVMVASAAALQTRHPAFAPGPSNELGADVTKRVKATDEEFRHDYRGNLELGQARSLSFTLEGPSGALRDGGTWKVLFVSGAINGTPADGATEYPLGTGAIGQWFIGSLQTTSVAEIICYRGEERISQRITLYRVQADPPVAVAAPSGGGSAGASASKNDSWNLLSGSPYVELGRMDMLPSASGNVACSANLTFMPDETEGDGSTTVTLKWQRETTLGSNSWEDVSAVTSGVASVYTTYIQRYHKPYEPDDPGVQNTSPASIQSNGSKAGVSGTQRFRLVAATSSGRALYVTGSATVNPA